MEAKYFDVEDQRFLERIEPFPGMVEGLEYIGAHANFRDVGRCPWLYVDKVGKNDDLYSFDDFDLSGESDPIYNESEFSLPDVTLRVYDPSMTEFEVKIRWSGCRYSASGNTVISCMDSSRFRYMFHIDQFVGYAFIKTDIPTIARFLTYYLSLFGYTDYEDYKVYKRMHFTSGDLSKAIIPEDIMIPEPLKKAIDAIKKLKFCGRDHLRLRITSFKDLESFDAIVCDIHGNEKALKLFYYSLDYDRKEMERRLKYRNSDCIFWNEYEDLFNEDLWVSVDRPDEMRFLVDYFLFLNPHLKQEDIMVSLDFGIWMNDDTECIDDWCEYLYNFYPDGSSDPEEKLAEYFSAVRKCREKREANFKNHP